MNDRAKQKLLNLKFIMTMIMSMKFISTNLFNMYLISKTINFRQIIKLNTLTRTL